jgi:hypothetical protein
MALSQNYATLRDLDELGVAAEALASLSAAHKRRGILAASARIAPYLRKRHQLPLRPDVTPIDTSGLVGGGSASLVVVSAPVLVQDIAVQVFDPGTVGFVGVTVQVSTDAGTTYGPLTALALTGSLTIDGVMLTLAGPLAAGDVVSWSTRVDFGLCEATVSIAAFIMLNNRGLDPASMETLEARWTKALQWATDIGKGIGELDGADDATPGLDEVGVLFDTDASPYAWTDTQRSAVRGG